MHTDCESDNSLSDYISILCKIILRLFLRSVREMFGRSDSRKCNIAETNVSRDK